MLTASGMGAEVMGGVMPPWSGVMLWHRKGWKRSWQELEVLLSCHIMAAFPSEKKNVLACALKPERLSACCIGPKHTAGSAVFLLSGGWLCF